MSFHVIKWCICKYWDTMSNTNIRKSTGGLKTPYELSQSLHFCGFRSFWLDSDHAVWSTYGNSSSEWSLLMFYNELCDQGKSVGVHDWQQSPSEYCECERTLCVKTAGRPRLLCVNRTQSLLVHLHTHTHTHTRVWPLLVSLPRLLWSERRGAKAQRWKVFFTGTALPLPSAPK